ncbi:MAG: DUF600 family protein [Thermoguttaceae bacterium]|nr:DUF600 family protein [Thermoguttaceae bacterium]
MIFEEKLADHYQKSANHLNAMVPVPWAKIAMLGTDTGDSLSGVFYFFTLDGKPHRCHKIPEEYSVSEEDYDLQFHELLELNHALWKEFIDANQPPWCGMIFTSTDDGAFDIKFEYGIHEKLGITASEAGWVYESFGINLHTGRFQELLLKEYFEEKKKYEERNRRYKRCKY